MPTQFIYITLAIVLAVLFQPLRRLAEKLTDKFFYRDRYDSQVVLNKLAHILTSEQMVESLLNLSLREICQNLKVHFGQFLILNETGNLDMQIHYGALQKTLNASDLSKLGQKLLIADQLSPEDPQLKLIQLHKVSLLVPLKFRKRLIGYLVLGSKLSGSLYSHQDLQLLEVIVPELAVALNNAEEYAQIAEFNISLKQKIHAATAKLQNAYKDLQVLDKSKDEFLSIASHQLRTPLAAIEGYLSMMANGDIGNLSDKQQEFTDNALERTNHMARLVSQLLDISAFNAKDVASSKQLIDLNMLVETEIKGLKNLAQQKGIKLVYNAPKQALPLLELNENRTRQVIMNMIDNAIFYTNKGSVTVALVSNHGKIRYTVKDTGIGVPADEKRKIFTKFFRATNARKVRPDGTGIGLYLASSVLQAEGGNIIFESKENEGSTFGFEVTMPEFNK